MQLGSKAGLLGGVIRQARAVLIRYPYFTLIKGYNKFLQIVKIFH